MKNKNINIKQLIIISVSTLALLVIVIGIIRTETKEDGDLVKGSLRANKVIDTDLVIPISNINESAIFYPVEVDGNELEVFAIKASDDTVRTAFNICKDCYASGRGYYVQDGDMLVCQYCGNRFLRDQIEKASGGCNPVPITEANKLVTKESITISKEYLLEASETFKGWK